MRISTHHPARGNSPAEWPSESQLSLFLPELHAPLPTKDSTSLGYAEVLGQTYLAFAEDGYRKKGGHYLTPASIARFMAECSPSYSETYLRVLDPGSGAGILSAAVCEAASNSGVVERLHIDAWESDILLAELTQRSLAFSREWLDQRGVALTFDVKCRDFVLDYATALGDSPKQREHTKSLNKQQDGYGLVIANPPYFKIGKDDPRAKAGASIVHGQPNIYALFMAISAKLLSESGNLVYIVPRSFASGTYFKRFREVFFQLVTPTAIHLFESRKNVFKNQTVLQENLILAAQRCKNDETSNEYQVLISHSEGADDLASRKCTMVNLGSVLDSGDANRELSIPVCSEDLELKQAVRAWPETLGSLGLGVSTGPVVPFRATHFLAADGAGPSTAPLLWMHHVRPMHVEWPSARSHKPQGVKVAQKSVRLLVENGTYVLLRRFSAKEEKRRLVAAPLNGCSFNSDLLGLENHLNYIHGVSRDLDRDLAYGLAALLNSVFLDRYFRVSNGNTQVSAAELRAMPLPAERDIRSIGVEVQGHMKSGSLLSEIDAIVAQMLNLSPELCTGPELATG